MLFELTILRRQELGALHSQFYSDVDECHRRKLLLLLTLDESVYTHELDLRCLLLQAMKVLNLAKVCLVTKLCMNDQGDIDDAHTILEALKRAQVFKWPLTQR